MKREDLSDAIWEIVVNYNFELSTPQMYTLTNDITEKVIELINKGK
jgi:hypothetical protein